jgi:hypothetical protein
MNPALTSNSWLGTSASEGLSRKVWLKSLLILMIPHSVFCYLRTDPDRYSKTTLKKKRPECFRGIAAQPGFDSTRDNRWYAHSTPLPGIGSA